MVKSAEDYMIEIKNMKSDLDEFDTNKNYPGYCWRRTKDPAYTANQLKTRISTYVGKFGTFSYTIDTREQKPFKLPNSTVTTIKTGDYAGYFESPEHKMFRIPICFERKSENDLYRTLMNKKSRERFYREIDRKGSMDFFIIVECSKSDFMIYKPVGSNANHKQLIPQKRGVLDSLEIRGAHVMWEGSRNECQHRIQGLCRQWVIKHFLDIV